MNSDKRKLIISLIYKTEATLSDMTSSLMVTEWFKRR